MNDVSKVIFQIATKQDLRVVLFCAFLYHVNFILALSTIFNNSQSINQQNDCTTSRKLAVHLAVKKHLAASSYRPLKHHIHVHVSLHV